MIFKDNTYNFSLKPVRYEFDQFYIDSDIYDLNWLVCKCEFTHKGVLISLEDTLFTTFEMLNFISEVEDAIKNKEYKKINLQNIEPNFIMQLTYDNNGYKIDIRYTYYLDEVSETIDLTVMYSHEEILDLLCEIKREFNCFPYRRIAKHFGKNLKYKSFNEIINLLNMDELFKNQLYFNSTDILIKKNEFFTIKISDVYYCEKDKFLYGISLNNKPYCYVEEDNLIEEIYNLYNNKDIIVEYIREIGFFNRRWFEVIKDGKYKLNKNVVRVFRPNELLYYNNKYILLKDELIHKNKFEDLDKRLVELYYSKDYSYRLQIIIRHNSFSYILEKLIIEEVVEYGNTYNDAKWIKLDNGENHSYLDIYLLKNDIENLINEKLMVKEENIKHELKCVKVIFFNDRRKEFPILSYSIKGGTSYRPHLIIKGTTEYLGVEFIQSQLQEFGLLGTAFIRLVYDGIDYSNLKVGIKFDIVEGANIVGEGEVISFLDNM